MWRWLIIVVTLLGSCSVTDPAEEGTTLTKLVLSSDSTVWLPQWIGTGPAITPVLPREDSMSTFCAVGIGEDGRAAWLYHANRDSSFTVWLYIYGCPWYDMPDLTAYSIQVRHTTLDGDRWACMSDTMLLDVPDTPIADSLGDDESIHLPIDPPLRPIIFPGQPRFDRRFMWFAYGIDRRQITFRLRRFWRPECHSGPNPLTITFRFYDRSDSLFFELPMYIGVWR